MRSSRPSGSTRASLPNRTYADAAWSVVKVELFRQNGQIFREDDELFTETSWAAVMMGQGIKMRGHNAMADAVREPNTRREIDEMEKSIQFVVQHMPSHGEYLNRYCPAPA